MGHETWFNTVAGLVSRPAPLLAEFGNAQRPLLKAVLEGIHCQTLAAKPQPGARRKGLSMTFRIKQYLLPYDGNIPGARGHKKIVISKGTRVWCIVYGIKIFWCAYLNEQDAIKCAQGLEKSLDPAARRTIQLDTLVAWNFKDAIPKRIHRHKEPS